MADKNFNDLENDLFSEDNINFNQNFINQSSPLINQEIIESIKIREDKKIKRTYGHEYSGSHYDVFQGFHNSNSLKGIPSSEIEKNINKKFLLKQHFNFNKKINGNDFAKHLIDNYNIPTEKAYIMEYVMLNLKEPNYSKYEAIILGKNPTSEIELESQKQFKDIFIQKHYQTFIDNFLKIKDLILDNSIDEKNLIENIKDINSFKYRKEDHIKLYSYSLTLIDMMFQFSKQTNLRALIEKEKGHSDIIDLFQKAVQDFLDQLTTRGGGSTTQEKELNSLKIIWEKVKSQPLEVQISEVLDNPDIPKFLFFKDKINQSDLTNAKLIPLINQAGLNEMLKDFELKKSGYSTRQGETIYYLEKKRNTQENYQIRKRTEILASTDEMAVSKSKVLWTGFKEQGLLKAKEKIISTKSTNNKNLNDVVFIDKYPELKTLINNHFDLNNKTPEKALLEAGVRGIELGVTLKNKDNVLLNIICVTSVLSEVLNVPVKDLFMNGSLGIAIGSRGRGSAVAHFEPNNNLVHATQKNEFTSFFHEMGHALDSAIATKINKDFFSHKKYHDDFTTKILYPLADTKNPNAEKLEETKFLLNDFIQLKNAFEESDMKKNSLLELNSKYWASNVELFARAFENYCSDKISDLKLPVIGVKDKYEKGIYLSEEDKKTIYPILESLIENYSSISKEVAREVSQKILKKDEVIHEID